MDKALPENQCFDSDDEKVQRFDAELTELVQKGEIDGYFYNIFDDAMGIDGDFSYKSIVKLAELVKKHGLA